MPRKKADSAPATSGGIPSQTDKGLPLVVKYLLLAMTQMSELIVEGDKTRARELEREIEDQLSFSFRGEALAALLAVVARERQLAEAFASVPINYEGPESGQLVSAFTSDRVAGLHDAAFEEGGKIIDV